MIPTYQKLMRPFLEVVMDAGGQEVRLRDVIDTIAEQFNLTEEEKDERLPSGRQTIFSNRVGWARTYLIKAGLIESPKRAHFIITSRGKNALKHSDTEIDDNYLKQFEEFNAFKGQKNEPHQVVMIH